MKFAILLEDSNKFCSKTQSLLEFAHEQQLPITSQLNAEFSGYLMESAAGIGLWLPAFTKTPYAVDFNSAQWQYRSGQLQHQREKLARACGINADNSLSALDLTAGFGRDACILASSGAHVTLVERHPIVAFLLQDGLARMLNHEVQSRLTLIKQDSLLALESFITKKQKVDVIYLDPMFEHSTPPKAKVKKELQILQALLQNENSNQDALLEFALQVAIQKVVVKRAILAPCLANVKPAYSLQGKDSRFDIYLPSSK